MSDESPSRVGLCVYCGTARPVGRPICPQCGRTWIDTRVGEELPALTPEIVEASAAERAGLLQQPAEEAPAEGRRRPWGLLIGALLGAAAVVVVVNLLIDGDGETIVAPTTTTAGTVTPATTSTTAAVTTAPPPTTTTAPATTTSTTTTSTTTTTLPPIPAEGEAVAVEDLTLGAFALGPFGFNATTSYLGRLVASLGQPDSRSEAGVDYGLCPDDTGAAYTWGALTAIFRLSDGIEVLVGYRLDDTGTDHPTQSITSRSGLELGHTVAILDAIYLQSGLAFEDIDGQPHFLLLRSTDDATLLWGPVSSRDPEGIVEGIYSPNACDGGPRPGT